MVKARPCNIRAWVRILPYHDRYFQKNRRHYKRDKGSVDGIEQKKISENKNTLAIDASKEQGVIVR